MCATTITYLINLRLYKILCKNKIYNVTFLSLSIYKWLDDHQDLVVNNKESLKLLKKNLQFTSQVIQIKPCGHHGRFFF